MKIGMKILATFAVLCLAAGGALVASQGSTPAKSSKAPAKTSAVAPAKTAAKTMTANGAVVSSSGNSLVISHKVNGKDEQMSFSTDATTQMSGGTAAPGAMVTVKYHSENGSNMATAVSVHPAKAAKPAKSGKSK